ncbi:hypothetical protein [Lentzea guizhouensis]|uniref:hypothetical protein n=1 Tax=Lentzea guizhouensis TaxID=1586287 RepID=UPI0012B6A426|nr:hypothetical protein [Lentzea guizhouensis]
MGERAGGSLSSRWRWVVLLLALVFLMLGGVTAAGSVLDGTAVVSGVLVGAAGMALGVVGIWRGLLLGVTWSSEGVEVRGLQGTDRRSWAEVEAVGVRLTPHDLLVFVKHADVVLVLASGEEEWLSPLATYTLSEAVPRRVETKAALLREALARHHAQSRN